MTMEFEKLANTPKLPDTLTTDEDGKNEMNELRSKSWDIRENEGIGPITLDNTRAQIRSMLGQPSHVSRSMDYYYNNLIQVEYKKKQVVFIQIDRGSKFNVCLRQHDIFSTPVEELLEFICDITNYDEDDPELGTSFIFPEIGVSFWRQVIPSESEPDLGRFHHAGSIGHQGKARITSIIDAPNTHGVYRARVEVFNPATGTWVTKRAPSTFFPDAWSRTKVLDEIRGAFGNQTLTRGNYFEGLSPSGVRIGGYLDDVGNINTAFPIY